MSIVVGGHVDPATAQKGIDDLNVEFIELGKVVSYQYELICNEFKKEWQGPSAYDYLNKLAKRLDNLVEEMRGIASGVEKAIAIAVNQRLDFEESNTLNGDMISQPVRLGRVEYYGMNEAPPLPIYELNAFIGLAVKEDGNVHPEQAKENIGQVLRTAIDTIKQKSNEMYEHVKYNAERAINSVETKKALNQLIAITDNYTAGDIENAIKDFYDALNILLVTNYKKIDKATADAISEVTTSARNINVGKSRWNMEK